MRIHYVLMGAAAAVYVASTELFVQGDRAVPDPDGGCRDAPGDFGVAALIIQATVLIATSVWVARSARSRWMLATALHAAVPTALATIAGVRYYALRMSRASECHEFTPCVGCLPSVWESMWLQVVLASAIATLIGLAAGAVARRVFQPR